MPEPRIELGSALQQHDMLPVGYIATLKGYFATLVGYVATLSGLRCHPVGYIATLWAMSPP